MEMDIHDRSIPASVRLYNIGAIGSSRDKHELKFGAYSGMDLPGSNGRPLPTPAFRSPWGGAAYFGHYVTRRASDRSYTCIRAIMDAYSTGHRDDYERTVCSDVDMDREDRIALGTEQGHKDLFRVMVAMGRWEANARRESSKNWDIFNEVYMTDPGYTELKNGLVAGIEQAYRDGFGGEIETAREPIVPEPRPTAPKVAMPANVEPTEKTLPWFEGYRDKIFMALTGGGAGFTAWLSQLQEVPFWLWFAAGVATGAFAVKWDEGRRTKAARRKVEMAEFLAWKGSQ